MGIIAIIAASFFGNYVFASSGTECNPKNYKEAIKCTEYVSSEIQITDQRLKAAKELELSIKQWVNPELEFERTSKGSEKSETTASLMFGVGFGKRAAEKKIAETEFEKERITSALNKHEIRLGIMLGFYKLSHLKSAIEIESESVIAFDKIVKQFERRPALSPEQKVSLSVFKMALADHRLSLTQLLSQQKKTLENLALASGLNKKTIQDNLPDRKQNWPILQKIEDGQNSPAIKIASSEVEIAKRLKDKSWSESWPELKIGPTIRKIKENEVEETLTGVSLSMPLPVFSINSHGRAYGEQKLIEAQMNYELTTKKVKTLREQLEDKYTTTVSSLDAAINSKYINEKHKEVENLFFKGVIPVSLVIEAHRQLYDLEQKRNELELEALEALGELYIIDDKFSEVIL